MTSEQKGQLPPEAKRHAAETLNETKETRKRGIQAIKKFSSKNPSLHLRTEDEYVLPFLRNCKFDVEKTKQKLKNYYIMKRDRKELFENRNPRIPVIEELIRKGSFVILKEPNRNLMVIISNPTRPDPKLYSLDDIFKTSMMVADVATMESELGQIYGYLIIVDLTNTSFSHVKQFSIGFMRNAIQIMQTYHCRPQKIAFVNVPMFLRVVMNMFKAIMPEKLRKRVHVCYDAESALSGFVDVDILPESYGGKGDSLEALGKYWMEKLIAYDKWFVEDEKYKAE